MHIDAQAAPAKDTIGYLILQFARTGNVRKITQMAWLGPRCDAGWALFATVKAG
jgi:hypothetical protein